MTARAPGSSRGYSFVAPGASAGSLQAPGRSTALPRVDDRLAPPETRLEYLHGFEIFAAPADQGHATRHWDLTYVLGAYVAKSYLGAVDMLTRTTEINDFAPDASIFPEDPDPVTGGRRLEELAFEISDKQSIGVPTAKARQLIARGVRRVFCVLVGKRRVMEWSRATDGWEPLPMSATIQDRCLVRSLPIAALLDGAASDDAVARALLAKGVPALEEALRAQAKQAKIEGKAEGRSEGRSEGLSEGISEGQIQAKHEMLAMILRERKLDVPPSVAAKIEACRDGARLDEWLRRALTASSASGLFDKPARKTAAKKRG